MENTNYAELRKLSPKVTGQLIRMKEEVFKDDDVPAKYKILSALVTVIVIKCEPCIKSYVNMAVKVGITEKELIEFLNVAIVEAGCPGEMWALKALEYYKKDTEIKLENYTLDCCSY